MAKESLKKERSGSRPLFLVFFVLALIISVTIHFLFYKSSQSWLILGFSPASYDQIVPRTFRMKRVEIDPKILEEKLPEEKKEANPKPVVIEQEKPLDTSFMQKEQEKPLSSPKHLDLQLLQQEIPQVLPGNEGGSSLLAEIRLPEQRGNKTPLETSLEPSVKEKNMPPPNLQEGMRAEEGEGNKFSSLDELLAGKEPVTEKNAPILMPTDLLFGYDADTLKPEAALSLAKLGVLIQRNAQARFRIEGHTDSFGSDEYNSALSLRRAEAVKNWLHQNMNIDTALMTTAGFGKTRLIASASGSAAEQQINRRVEIVITSH